MNWVWQVSMGKVGNDQVTGAVFVILLRVTTAAAFPHACRRPARIHHHQTQLHPPCTKSQLPHAVMRCHSSSTAPRSLELRVVIVAPALGAKQVGVLHCPPGHLVAVLVVLGAAALHDAARPHRQAPGRVALRHQRALPAELGLGRAPAGGDIILTDACRCGGGWGVGWGAVIVVYGSREMQM